MPVISGTCRPLGSNGYVTQLRMAGEPNGAAGTSHRRTRRRRRTVGRPRRWPRPWRTSGLDGRKARSRGWRPLAWPARRPSSKALATRARRWASAIGAMGRSTTKTTRGCRARSGGPVPVPPRGPGAQASGLQSWTPVPIWPSAGHEPNREGVGADVMPSLDGPQAVAVEVGERRPGWSSGEAARGGPAEAGRSRNDMSPSIICRSNKSPSLGYRRSHQPVQAVLPLLGPLLSQRLLPIAQGCWEMDAAATAPARPVARPAGCQAARRQFP